MAELLIRRLEHFTSLSEQDKDALQRIATQHIEYIGPHQDLAHEGDPPGHIRVFLDGWACRYKTLEDGRRQIIAFFLPGDMCDPNIFILKEMDHSIAAITPVRVGEISKETFLDLTGKHPRITQALWWASLVDSSVQREWTVNLGQRNALERMAHLFCELFCRLSLLGLTQGDRCQMPLTQAELAEALGISTVHVNRTLQELRNEHYVEWRGRELTIPDFERLRVLGLFSSNYLHLGKIGSQIDANDR